MQILEKKAFMHDFTPTGLGFPAGYTHSLRYNSVFQSIPIKIFILSLDKNKAILF